MNPSAEKFVLFIDGHLAGFYACIHFPHPKIKNMKRGHRLVILPQFQGLGLGILLSSWVGNYYVSKGLRFRATTAHPSLIYQRLRTPNWTFVHKKDNKDTYLGDTIKGRFSAGFRSTYTFEYILEENN
jgi:hypothetical protein